jgi:hypothetical protein
MPAGRPKKDNETLQLRVPRKLVIIAKQMHMNYKELLVTQFEKMMCAKILVELGIEGSEICEQIIERNRIIDERYRRTLAEYTAEQKAKSIELTKMAAAIQQAVLDGKTRGEAESEFGRVFPDHIWKKYSGGKP